ncbi:PAS domain-containing protein [Rhodocytophaga rosea]|uniref:histidine kinase n=1 Tax=Rhodocytophaga rosea TaxID=2704465 RepID=A0A6C0GIB9_9BACT|nr:PAS domain-containing protein [Rhodocytophaga rosea]QHT67687.1 PAS domain-containing protein [Rhodocytophaga rosea]
MKSNLLSFRVVKSTTLENLKLIIEQRESEIKSATDFIKEIEKGNLEFTYSQTDSAQSNGLAVSLLSMRDQMKKVAEDEKERKWVTEGLARFVEILRSNTNENQSLADDIISHLVKYMNANQGGLFIVNEDDQDNPYLELVACYAYDRKKFVDKKISIGQGLAGQAYLEKDTIYMTAVPDDYVQITSGLGNALPRNILIVPLKLNDQVFGIVELASFHSIKKYQIEFVEKLGESIASAISSVKINDKTRKLLEESQLQTESMRSQEEEMRQNMEELSATQEEMQRIVRQSQEKELYLNELINSINDTILTIDLSYKIVSWNKALERNYNITVHKGFDALHLYPQEGKSQAKAAFGRALAGETFQVTETYNLEGGEENELYIAAAYSPLKDTSGEIIGALLISKNITPTMAAQKKAERLLVETQRQTEELSSTQEVMKGIMDEVQGKERFMNEIMNATKDRIFTIDKTYKIIICNQTTKEAYQQMGVTLEKGYDILSLFNPEQKATYKSYYDRALGGEYFEITQKYLFGEVEQYFSTIYSPLRNTEGEIIGAAAFGKDITETILAKNQADQLAKENQFQNEELKAQQEELHQNLEELSTTQEEMNRRQEELTHLLQRFNLVVKTTTEGLWDMIVPSSMQFNDDTPFWWADKFRQMVGYSNETDFPNRLDSWANLLHPDHKEYTLAAFNAHLIDFSGNTPYDVEYQLKLKNGQYRWFRAVGNTLRDEQGKPLRIAGTLIDIQALKDLNAFQLELEEKVKERTHELQAQEEELRQNMEELSATQEEIQRVLLESQEKEAYLREVINAMPDVIYTVDCDYKVITWNEVLEKSYNLKVEKGFNILHLYEEYQRPGIKSKYDRAIAGEGFQENETYDLGAGNELHITATYSPLKNNAGQVTGVLFISRNVTQSVAAHKKTEKLLAEVQSKEDMLNNLINITDDSIVALDKAYKIICCNQVLRDTYLQYNIKVDIGFDMMLLIPEQEKALYKSYFDRALAGETVEVSNHFKNGEIDSYVNLTYSP